MRTLFLDFHGTICHDPFWRSLDSVSFRQVQHSLFEANASFVDDWMRGKYTAEEINELVAKWTGLAFDHLWQAFVQDCESMHVDPEILAEIQSLQNRYRVVLITDNMDSFDRFTVPALGLDAVFDVIVNSFNEGVLKNDRDGITFTNQTKGKISKEDALVDDSTSCCKTFEDLGGTSFIVNDQNQTINHLKNLGA